MAQTVTPAVPPQQRNGGVGVSDAAVESISGAVGSVLALLATYPLKTIYTLQALSAGQANGGANTAAALSMLDIIRRYKLSGLFVGIEPNIFESAVSSGVYFYFYSKLRRYAVMHSKQRQAQLAAAAGSTVATPTAGTSSKNADIGALASLLVAALAGAGNQLITMPASVVATRMQAHAKAHQDGKTELPTGLGGVCRMIYAEGGIGGFWAGLLPSLVLVINPAIQYMLFEQFTRAVKTLKARARAKQVQSSRQRCQSSSSNLDNTASHGSSAALAVQAVSLAAQTAGQGAKGSNTSRSCSAALNGTTTNGLTYANVAAHNMINGTPNGTASSSADSKPALAAPLSPIILKPWETFMVGALAKVGATLATYWLVVVKSRLQAQGKQGGVQYDGALHAIRVILRDEGAGGFFKGLRAKILQTALNAALMLMLKEQVYSGTKHLLNSSSLKKIMTAVITA